MFTCPQGRCELFGVQRCRGKERYDIDVPVIQHLFQMASHRIRAGFGLSLLKRIRVDIANTGQSATGMMFEAVHPSPAESQTDNCDIESG